MPTVVFTIVRLYSNRNRFTKRFHLQIVKEASPPLLFHFPEKKINFRRRKSPQKNRSQFRFVSVLRDKILSDRKYFFAFIHATWNMKNFPGSRQSEFISFVSAIDLKIDSGNVLRKWSWLLRQSIRGGFCDARYDTGTRGRVGGDTETVVGGARKG